MVLITSIVQAKITKMNQENCLCKDTERLEEKIVLDAFMLKMDSECIKSDVIFLAKIKVALKIYSR